MAKNERTMQEINNAYFRKTAELGDLEFRLYRIPIQIDEIKRELLTLNKEADAAQARELKKQQDAAKAAADKVPKKAATQEGAQV